jgi:hypothetical protein
LEEGYGVEDGRSKLRSNVKQLIFIGCEPFAKYVLEQI